MGYQFQQLSEPINVPDFSLFNSIDFLSRHQSNLLQFLIKRKSEIVGVIHFNLIGDKALSPWKASFGGFEFSKELPYSIISHFVTWVISQVVRKNIAEIQITFPPDFYKNSAYEIMSDILQDCDFQVCVETGQALVCGEKNFSQLINRFERSKLERSLSDSFRSWKGIGELPEAAFQMIVKNRERKNIPVKLEYAELKENFVKFSDNFHWFGVWKGDEIAAASVGISVQPEIMYHFFPGHDNKFDAWSPMVLLLNELYGYCLKKEIKYLDLGISSVDGKINQGLYQFKKNLGAMEYKQAKFKWTAE
jgi:hypothetical protein